MRVTLGRTFRFGVLVALVSVVSLPVFAGSAVAKGKPSVVMLTCPIGVDATGTVQLQTSVFGGPASPLTPISCTSGQTSKVSIKPTSQPAPAFAYYLSFPPLGGCSGSGTRGTGPFDCFAGAPTLDVS